MELGACPKRETQQRETTVRRTMEVIIDTSMIEVQNCSPNYRFPWGLSVQYGKGAGLDWRRVKSGVLQESSRAAGQCDSEHIRYKYSIRSEERRVGKKCRSRWS